MRVPHDRAGRLGGGPDQLSALLVLFKKAPPPGHRLFIVGTTSSYDALRHMGITGTFSKIQHVNMLESKSDVMKLLGEIGALTPEALAAVDGKLKDHSVAYSAFDEVRIRIGAKKLYLLAEMARQAADQADTFLFALYEECKANGGGL